VPALVFGVAFGNLLLGVPFHYDADLRVYYTGTFIGLINPFALLTGIVSLAMLTMHGGFYLQMRTDGSVQSRAARAGRYAAATFVVAFAVAGYAIATGIDGYRILTMPPAGSAFVPVAKTVAQIPGAWLDNYGRYPWSMAAPIAAFGGAVLAFVLSGLRRPGLAFVLSGVAVTGVVLTAGFAMFPFVMPSSSHPASSLTVWDSVSSHRTLQVMFWAALIFLPLIIVYTSWVYHVMRGPVTERKVHESGHSLY